jgi:hypothetical protein
VEEVPHVARKAQVMNDLQAGFDETGAKVFLK